MITVDHALIIIIIWTIHSITYSTVTAEITYYDALLHRQVDPYK